MKKLSTLVAVSLSALLVFTACGKTTTPTEPKKSEAQESQAGEEKKPEIGADTYIAVVSKGKQHQFWQAVEKGSNDAKEKYGVGKLTFEGPKSEKDVADQVQMLDSALNQKPAAIALAALDTQAVTDQLTTAKNAGIPVVGFDSGVPNAPEGSILATAATNNAEAAGLGAVELVKAVAEKVKAASADMPAVIGVVSQDQTSASIIDRTQGFVDKAVEELKKLGLGDADIAVTGADKFAKGEAKGAKVHIYVSIASDPQAENVAAAATTVLNMENVVGIFGSNEGAANGVIQASNEGVVLKEKGIVGVGFDAGERQKAVVKAGYFLGSVSQDPVQIGFQAVELCVKALKGETIGDVSIPAVFYDANNMDKPDVAILLYD